MYTLIRNARTRETLAAEVPSFFGALLIAEAYFKFHSFSLECLGFLATWLSLSTVASLATRRWLATSADANGPPGS